MQEKTTLRSLIGMIDHSLLQPTLTDAGIIAGCKLARRLHVATVCVKPYSIPLVRKTLGKSDVGICAVIGFPHGNSTTEVKVFEAKRAIRDGATEIDMVINIGKAMGGDWNYVSREIKAVNNATVKNGAILKVIFENDYLQDSHIVRLCRICSSHSVAFVKTSTGYGFVQQKNGMYAYKGAMPHHLRLMRKNCSGKVQIKAAGGIRSLDALLEARRLGATRIGTSSTKRIAEEARDRGYR
jgi:deoxyribose-phosphate aldolase